MPIESFQYLILLSRVNTVFILNALLIINFNHLNF